MWAPKRVRVLGRRGLGLGGLYWGSLWAALALACTGSKANDADAPEPATDGDLTDGDATDGDATDGDLTDGDATDGDLTDGDATDGDATDGDATDGDATDGDATDGDATDPGSDAPGDAMTDGPNASEPPTPNNTESCGNLPGQLFPPEAPWNTSIADAPLDAESDAIIGYLDQNHDTGTRFQIDFSFRVLEADDSVEHRAFTPTEDFYAGECDPAPVPVPEGGALEGESGYACDSDGDCHLIVFDRDECRLFEMWRADLRGEDFRGGCLAVWEVDRVYGPEGRGDFCTSADAAGLPITPFLFTADEVVSGEIRHALRFILPNQHIRRNIYVRPGTHSTRATSGPATAPPYSARLRLRADVDLAGLSRGAQVVARALQTYGMILADGGNLTFTGLSDRDTEHSWSEAELGPHDLKGLDWTDFEVVELGERIDYASGDCRREPVRE